MSLIQSLLESELSYKIDNIETKVRRLYEAIDIKNEQSPLRNYINYIPITRTFVESEGNHIANYTVRNDFVENLSNELNEDMITTLDTMRQELGATGGINVDPSQMTVILKDINQDELHKNCRDSENIYKDVNAHLENTLNYIRNLKKAGYKIAVLR